MEEISLKLAAKNPYFQQAVSVGIQNLLAAAQVLSSVGIKITSNIADTLREIHVQLTDAAYEVTNLDELLKQAQEIGRNEVVAQKKEIRTRPGTLPEGRESEGDATPG
jgi:hypothetical protein